MSALEVNEALQLLLCCVNDKELKKTLNNVMAPLFNKTMQLQDAIKLLSEHIIKVENAKLFRKYLSNILLALVSAKIPLKPVFSSRNYDVCNDSEKIYHLEYSVVLAVLSDHPDVLQYALKYFEVNPIPPFEVFIHHADSYNVAPKKRRLANCRHKVTDLEIVTCCYTLLMKLPNELCSKWDWTNFVENFSNHESKEIRWMVKECMGVITNLTEAQLKIISRKLVTNDKDSINNICQPIMSIRPVDNIVTEENFNISGVVNIDGIMLPVFDKGNIQKGKLVPVKSTINNLRSLALAVASGKAVSLLGPVGSGKTSLVEHLVTITGRKGVAFKKVQLGDQTDSRMLLGSHQCTDVPGEFIWRPGVLTEAVQNGHWLLLEDIDSAALDVASTLSSMLERNTLCVPGYRDSLPVSPEFQLFVTQRTVITNYGFQKKISNSSTLLQKHLTQINVEPLSRSELAEIIQTLYPSLTTITSRMIEVFMMFSFGSHDTSLQSTGVESEKDKDVSVMRGTRLISTRDLMKWCSRSVQGFEISSPESGLKVLQDALDIFTCSVSSPEDRLKLAKRVGTCLGVSETKSEFYCKHYKPNVTLTSKSLDVGRAKVPRIEKTLESIELDNKRVVFSFTRQSACTLERIACCVTSNEPVLLVGETGTGKTSSVQYLARQTGHKLVVINMNQQSDSADLLGGYKPVDMKYVIRPIRNEFENLFRNFYNVEKNKKFLGHIETCYQTENWTALLALMKQSYKAAVNRLTNEKKEKILKTWLAFGQKLKKLELQIQSASRLTFAFIEGSLVKAMQEGHWVLLDEINLASSEILECLAGLLEDKNESIDLIEKGDKVPIKRHPNFTLFACMNPATDVGKKDLPVGLRNRFTEFFIDELTERNDLVLLIGDYLYHLNLNGAILEAIYVFYANIRKEAKLNLVDGAGNAPHYSLRTLCRALTAAAKAKCGTVARSLYEAFCLSFLTQLDSSSHPKVEAMIAKAVLGKKILKSILNQLIPEPQLAGQNFLLFEGHWIPQGKLDITIPDGYILTPTVKKNLRDIARIVSLGRLPVLLQGDTSVGKTSLITYIAKASGNYCVRINNHEHTDLQEYIGSYATDASGKLVFKEGVLVEAMRKGYWIILDELNLAPSDVLEALNRVLDDNRELFIPETQQVIKADPNFMLFATQNPPGLYGGRKMLSRAFRNRFVELHFDEIPKIELETILHQRCHVPPAYCKKMIAVMAELQTRRRGSAAVQGKDGFITLRDLFRWGQRYKHASKEMLTDNHFYDWDQHIADEGYLILAGKVRQPEERNVIEEVIEKQIKRKVIPDNLFNLNQTTSPVTKPILEILLNNQLEEFSHVVWTYNMRRLAILISKAFTFDEPVLLVGETGCGKTTICQILAALSKRKLLSINCHMHTESSDFLGGLRPVRQYKNDGRLFEWVDGPLVKAMENGDMFLADEISLADDSVLERMNSLLEPERQLVLSERGLENNSDVVVITAHKNFHFIGTMNPGGDFGKKELSPALRNRFTEIWCDTVTTRDDLLKVLEKSVHKGISLGNQEDGSSGIGNSILDFTDWLKQTEVTNKFPFSIRDLLSWVHFINTTVFKGLLDTPEAYVHGACLTFLDCFGTALTGHIEWEALFLVRKAAINFLLNQIQIIGNEYTDNLREMLSDRLKKFKAESDGPKFGIRPFYIEVGPKIDSSDRLEKFTFTAPTTGANTLRLLRGIQLNKAILLEGNPGVGKTSLVSALAKYSGHKIVRMNLSDQTDITDLFGSDLPAEDGSFTFKEGAFLSALQNGDWILLDELNLAPQSVLEGLNACLDHRGEVYIPELGKTFKVKHQTRLFACQNPLKQGGARRGLPVSFLNRFTQVYIDTLTKDDLIYIVESQYSSLPTDILHRIVNFNCKVAHEITEIQSWGHRGGPWEMNLRDIQRWCEALIKDQCEGRKICPGKFVDMLYINRMRTVGDKERMLKIYEEFFCPEYPRSDANPQFGISDKEIMIGDVTIGRIEDKCFQNRRTLQTSAFLLRDQMTTLKALAQGVKMNWLSILVGPTATGKTSLVQMLADLTGNNLEVIPVTSAMDVSDLLGGFEQVDYNRNLESLFEKIEILTTQILRKIWLETDNEKNQSNKLLTQLYKYKCMLEHTNIDHDEQMYKLNEKVHFLLDHCLSLLEYGKYFDGTMNKLEEIIDSLRNLKSKLDKVSSVNTGGKFEWVDSLLVKTLIEGSWLLLDNVNLTSAAVLDRLNGLLEPNGVLSIPERGEVCEIVPHPNFRVFFTMDPKYGEISRAMRNRGVEVFLLKSEEWNANLADTIPYMDLTALLSSCGLPMNLHDLFITCHETMTSFVQGLERPTLSHLLQAGYLTSQQIIRAIPLRAALVNSFSDVYIKTRCGSDFASNVTMSLAEMKNNMLKTLVNIVDNRKITDSVSNSHTLSVKGICNNSLVEMAKQLAYNVIQVVEDYGTTDERRSQILFNVCLAYQRCSKEMLPVLHCIIKRNFVTNNEKENERRDIGLKLNDVAFRYSNEYLTFESYKRFYSELYTLSDSSLSKANANLILLLNSLLKKYIDMTLPKAAFTFFDYSEAVDSGSLVDDFVEYPLLKHCKKYMNMTDTLIENTFKSMEGPFNDETLCRLIQLLNWRNRFYKMCMSPMFVSKEGKTKAILRESLVRLLYVHSTWLKKYLFNELFKLLSPNHSMRQDIKNTVHSITTNYDQNSSEMSKISKKLRKLYGHPKLYENKEEYNLCLAKNNIYKNLALDLHQPLDNLSVKLVVDMTEVCDTELAFDVPKKSSLEIIQSNVAKFDENPKLCKQLLMKHLPVNSYVLLRILGILRNDFFDTMIALSLQDEKVISLNSDLKEILKNVVHFGTLNNVLTPDFLNVLCLLQNVYEGNINLAEQRISAVPCKFWEEFYKALVYSPAMYSLPFFGLQTVTDSSESVPTNTRRLSMNLPLLLYYMQKVTLSEGQGDSRQILAYEIVSLEDRSDYSIRLASMSNIIWKNIGTLDSIALTTLKSNANFEIRKYEQLMLYLHSALMQNKPDLTQGIEETCLITIEKLRQHLIDETVVADMATEANSISVKLRAIIERNEISDKNQLKVLTAQLALLTSLLIVKFMAELKPVDHVEKHRLKVNYIEEDLKMFEALLSGYYMQGLVYGNILETKKVTNKDITMDCIIANKQKLFKIHPHCEVLLNLRTRTADNIHKYASGNTFRPEEPTYDSFVKYCRHFTRSVLSTKTISDIAKNLLNISNDLLENIKNNERSSKVVTTSRSLMKEASSWLYSVNAFCKKVESEYAEAFPDLAKPLLTSVSQIVYSMTSMNDLLREMVVKIDNGAGFVQMVTDLVKYPNNIPRREEKQQHLNRFLSSDLMNILKAKVLIDEDGVAEKLEKMEVLKMNLSELRMHCTASESVDAKAMESIQTTLNALVETWQQQQADIEQKKQDDEALYVTKSKCEDEDDEVIAQQEINEMFPSYTDSDFGEFKPPTLEKKPSKITEHKSKPKLVITPDDVSLVYKWHSSFIRYMTKAEWLANPKKLVGNDVVSPSLQRYPTFSRVIDNSWEALDAEIEGVLTPSFLVLLSQIKAKVEGNDGLSSKIDFYNSPWVSETKHCVPLLLKVKESTNLLLDQWPDFPTLKDIMVIINRILSFPLTSPVSRLLTGLELLRDKIEEWNKNAHKGNNMIEESLAVGQQIINWRKLEMGHWKECLNNLYLRKQAEAHKYWFYLYNVVKSYLVIEIDSEPISPIRVISVLKDFMEKSNLVEYEVRLDIIYVYHCHLLHLETSSRRDELLSILWNTYNYYSQFSAQVASYIKEKRAPIEKKLRDFVKICTWDRDLSYWSVKDTVDKAHKALHKHTKEFENVLKESVASCLVENNTDAGVVDHVGIWDRPKRATTGAATPTGGAYMVDPQNFVLLMRNIKKYLDHAEQQCSFIAEGSLLSKIPSLLNKAKILCKDTITNSGYPSLVQALDDFVTLVIETSTHLGGLEVDASQPKDKQVSQAKNFVQQKRKALADLFKYLIKMGLNYRTGLVILSASADDLYDFTIPPIDLDAAMSYLKNRRCDASLGMLWSGCEKYFQRNIARHRLLSVALQSPHQDLGIQNIDRCKGFTAQLMKLSNTQKKSISKYSRYLYDLRSLATSLTNVLDIDPADTNTSTIKDKLEILTECYVQCGISLDQFNVLLKSCPENTLNSDREPAFDSVLSSSPIVRCYKNSDEWHDLSKRVNKIITLVGKQKTVLLKLIYSNPKLLGRNKDSIAVITQSHIDVAKEALKHLEEIVTELDCILNDYQFRSSSLIENYIPRHPMLRSLVDLSDFLKETMRELENLDESIDVVMEDSSIDTLVIQSEDLLATMLLVIQSVYKRHLPKDENDDLLHAIDEIIDKDAKEKEESKDLLDDKHLKEHLQDNLSSDAKLLQLEVLIQKISSLLANYVQYTVTAKNLVEGKNVVMRLVPILEQTVLFVQYIVTQKVAVHRVTCKMLSVLLKIFSDLAAKGFCKPSDLETEEGEGGDGPGKLSGGTGLGEGEGQKDVSDRIESQDQLEEANRAGEDKKEEDRDCKEEEKGVNMTDDFDSHLQDVEKKKGDESEEEDEDDADKQMGDTDNAAEKLDQQIWGSEDEDVDENQENKEKEEKGQGESTGEKNMGAKEEEKGTDDGSEGKDKKEKKDINEMKEPEVDEDHVDPYHGNHPQYPEPEDFDLPDDMNLDGEDGNDKEGETETENPFEIDVTEDDIPKEQEEMEQDDKGDETKGDKHGFEVSSDEEDGEPDDEKKNDEERDKEEDEENQQLDETEAAKDEGKENEDDADADPQESEEAEHQEENHDEKELPKNPDEINDDEKIEQKNHESNPQANPSNDDQSAEDRAENAEIDRGTDDNVETNAEQSKDEESAAFEQAQEQVGEDKQSMGRSELDKSEKGHRGEKEAASRADRSLEKRERHENKPGKTDQERTLGNVDEKKQKQMHTLNVEREEEAEDGGEGNHDEEKHADAYQHVKQARNDDLQAIDAATKEQADQQPTLQQEDEEAEELKEDEQVAMDVDDDELQVEKSEELKPEKVKEGIDKDKEKAGNKNDGSEEPTGETGLEIEGETVLTAHVPRGKDTTYHTKLEGTDLTQPEEMSVEQYMSIREWLTSGPSHGHSSANVWRSLWQEAAPAARALCERLRLVLEPTGRSRRAGDFRTGRAINMRRVIPYIASHFRKDRIWLRRTKPAKREYKIAIAVDDSSSMSDNRSKELAFESLALVSQALNLLESGDLAVLSFGEKPNLLHPFTEQFSEHSGSKILEQLRFEQTKTKIAQLLDFCTVLFEEQAVRSDALNAKLLVVVSDGRGIFSEGETRVIQSVRRARQQGIFLVYVIIDNPNNKDSVMDIRRPLLDPVTNSLTGFVPYLDTFPFPFYLILRDMSALPTVLGDALRQWFELAANTAS